MTTEPDLTEAMEVWLRAVDTFTQAPVPHRQAAARVIATALEARDAELARLRQINAQLVTEHNAMNLHGAKQDSRIRELEGVIASARERLDQFSTEGGGRKFERDMRTILTKQEPKS